MFEKSFAPFTDNEVESLNQFQNCGFMHPFTSENSEILIATKDGWVEKEGGPVVQNWAHKWMTNWVWKDLIPDWLR